MAGGINPFIYASSNPINSIDPDGQFVITVPTLVVYGVLTVATAYYGTKAINETAKLIKDSYDNNQSYPNLGTGGSCPNGDDDDPEDEHYKKRRNQARSGDSHREIGEPNRVIRDGKQYIDADNGNSVYVRGNRVVITDKNGNPITQFKNPKANTLKRIRNGKWIPK